MKLLAFAIIFARFEQFLGEYTIGVQTKIGNK